MNLVEEIWIYDYEYMLAKLKSNNHQFQMFLYADSGITMYWNNKEF